jgi:hypothetical protein
MKACSKTVTMGTAMGRKPRNRRVRPRDRQAILQEIKEMKLRFALAEEARVVSCCEAGREGFWLGGIGVGSLVEVGRDGFLGSCVVFPTVGPHGELGLGRSPGGVDQLDLDGELRRGGNAPFPTKCSPGLEEPGGL